MADLQTLVRRGGIQFRDTGASRLRNRPWPHVPSLRFTGSAQRVHQRARRLPLRSVAILPVVEQPVECVFYFLFAGIGHKRLQIDSLERARRNAGSALETK